MLIIDGHLDLAWNALQWNRNLLYSAYTIRTLEARESGKGRAQGTVALPELRRGHVALCFSSTTCRSTGQPVPHIDYATPMQAYGVAQGQIAYYKAMEREGYIRRITSVEQLDSHMAEWEAWDTSEDAEPTDAPPLGCVLSMEGADPVLQPDQLQEWWESGIRLLGPTHYGPGRYAGGTGTELGLTDLGPSLLKGMQRLGILLDMTHLSDQAFWQALDIYDGPVLASHNNCRSLVPHQRQFSDEQLKAIFERDGVIGSAFDLFMLVPGWTSGQSNESATIDTVVDHIDYVCQLAGNSRHAAIGTDLDGGYGREQSPSDLDTIIDLQKIPALLAKRGYSDSDIAAVMHGNWLRLLRQAWSRSQHG